MNERKTKTSGKERTHINTDAHSSGPLPVMNISLTVSLRRTGDLIYQRSSHIEWITCDTVILNYALFFGQPHIQ